MSYWYIAHKGSAEPVIPFDCNPGSDDEGMLVYRSFKACQSACKHQFELYGVLCRPQPLDLDTREYDI